MSDGYLGGSSNTDISLLGTGNVIMAGKYWHGRDDLDYICSMYLYDWFGPSDEKQGAILSFVFVLNC